MADAVAHESHAMTVQPRLPLTGSPHRTSTDLPASSIEEANRDDASSRRDAAPRVTHSPVRASSFAFDLVIAVLCLAVVCWVTVVRTPAHPADATASVGVAHQGPHARPPLDSGEKRSLDDKASDDDGDERG